MGHIEETGIHTVCLKEIIMKKLILILLSVILVLSVTSCKKGDNTKDPTDISSSAETTSVVTDEPISETKTVDGLELTITLDKGTYSYGDTITATVSVKNLRDESVFYTKYSGNTCLSANLFDNGVEKYTNSIASNGMEEDAWIEPGNGLTDTFKFDTDAVVGEITPDPMIKEMLDPDGEWVIKAYCNVKTRVYTDVTRNEYEEKSEHISIEITVPH